MAGDSASHPAASSSARACRAGHGGCDGARRERSRRESSRSDCGPGLPGVPRRAGSRPRGRAHLDKCPVRLTVEMLAAAIRASVSDMGSEGATAIVRLSA